jgi:hypothetical protein
MGVSLRPASEPAHLLALRKNPSLLLWFLYIASLPFYFGPSGLPQPGNLLVIVLVPLVLSGWGGMLEIKMARTLRLLLSFVVWVFIVNWGWAAVTGKFSARAYALVPVYYVFNATVVLLAVVLYRRYGDRLLVVTLYAVLFDSAFQFVASFVYRTHLYRGQLFFNNPNQLGYWSLLAACIVALTHRRANLGVAGASIGVSACTYLAILSGSRAAVAGTGMLLALLIFTNPRIIFVCALAALALTSIGGPIAKAIDVSESRARADASRTTSFADERGYSRIRDHWEYAVIGAGEGDITRFVEDADHANEIHSSLGTVVFSYGIVGTIIFLWFFGRVLQGAPRRAILMLLPVLVYTVAHQGLRFTLFWILIAVFIALKSAAGTAMPSGARASAMLTPR